MTTDPNTPNLARSLLAAHDEIDRLRAERDDLSERLFNEGEAHVAVQAEISDLRDRLADALAAQALLVERAAKEVIAQADMLASAGVDPGQIGALSNAATSIRALLAPDTGVKALAERDALKVTYEDLYADALADAESDAQGFESDLWKSIRSILDDLGYDWSGDTIEDGVTAEEAAQFIRDAMEGETHRAEKAERDDLRARLAEAERRVEALTGALGRAQRALKPFADRVFDDNGDCTVSDTHTLKAHDYWNAKNAERIASAALSPAGEAAT